jgi:uncharacterized protein (TIGR02117 family)
MTYLIKKCFLLVVLISLVVDIVAENKVYDVYIAQGQWHTGLILKTKDLCDELFPEVKTYSNYNYLDIGWGDYNFYTSSGNDIKNMLNAAFHPTPSVLLVLPYKSHPRIIYGNSKIIKLSLDETQFLNLCKYVSNSFIRDNVGKPIATEFPDFYLAKRKYHMFRTCNTWIVATLKNAGLKIRVFPTVFEWQVFSQLEKLKNTQYVQ